MNLTSLSTGKAVKAVSFRWCHSWMVVLSSCSLVRFEGRIIQREELKENHGSPSSSGAASGSVCRAWKLEAKVKNRSSSNGHRTLSISESH